MKQTSQAILYDAQGNVVKAREDQTMQRLRSKVLTTQSYNPDYEFDDSFRPANPKNPLEVHTTPELLQCLDMHPNIQFEARVLGMNEKGHWSCKKMTRESFQKSFAKDVGSKVSFKEADAFATDTFINSTIGSDFTPLLGGPFYKNLYYYQDYIRMHAEAFYAKNHDPIANAIIEITRDFVLGTGFKMECETTTKEGKAAMAVWGAFEKANNLQEQIDQCANELSIYGEVMWWWLPNYQSKIVYQLKPENIPHALIPRVRLTDPSNLVEIVTYPEDITRVLFYVWLTPTQYQIYTSGTGIPGSQGSDPSTGQPIQPTLKFIYQQIPAEQMMHYKINSVSNEKRGRSDLFPVFSYLKRLRDSVNYSLIALQKVSAWSMDTEVDGDQTDIDDYVRNQAALGTIPSAGSEFVHSKRIKRQYLGNSNAGGNNSNSFEWCLSMICAGVRIPMNYLGTHLSGGSTKASAIVSTEPVAKKMEKRREVMKRMLTQMWDRLMKEAGLPPVQCNIIFPELITQDRSQKLKDILLMQQNRWVSPQTAASIAAKEMMLQNYVYEKELAAAAEQLPEIPLPLSDPGKVKGGQMQVSPEQKDQGVAGLTSQDRSEIKKNDSKL